MKNNRYIVVSNKELAPDMWEMKLEGDVSEISAPGQFINIKLEGCYLRRPISICDWDDRSLTIIYKVVGKGTKAMAGYQPGKKLEILCPLGNGYDLSAISEAPVLAGGGAGVPPMYGLAKALIAQGKQPKVILGFNTKTEVFYEAEFKALGADVTVTTGDGSYGTKGFVTDGFEPADYGCACGPEPMLRAVAGKVKDGQFSFEARMGCGFGGCMGCSCETKYGYKRICKEGPVLRKEEIIW